MLREILDHCPLDRTLLLLCIGSFEELNLVMLCSLSIRVMVVKPRRLKGMKQVSESSDQSNLLQTTVC